MNLDQIVTFLAVYQHGSYLKACEELYVPQPTISHRISQLEKNLGKPLLIRGKGPVRLTEEGKAFLPYARTVVYSLKDGKEAVEALEGGEHGKLTIGCGHSFSAMMLPAILDSFICQYPNIKVNIYTYTSNELLKLIKNKVFQIGITRYAGNDPSVSYQQIHSADIMLMVSADHRFAGTESLAMGEIVQEPLLMYHKETQYRKSIDSALILQGFSYNIKYESNSLALIKQLLLANKGVFLFDPAYMKPELDRKQVVAIPIRDNPFVKSKLFLSYREGQLNSLDFLFMRHLKETFGIGDSLNSRTVW